MIKTEEDLKNGLQQRFFKAVQYDRVLSFSLLPLL